MTHCTLADVLEVLTLDVSSCAAFTSSDSMACLVNITGIHGTGTASPRFDVVEIQIIMLMVPVPVSSGLQTANGVSNFLECLASIP
jgi:hypothetical protein